MNITWNIKGLNVYHYQDEEGNVYNNTINTIKYEVEASDLITGKSVSLQGTGILDHPTDASTFTDINSVTEETVKTWLFNSFGTNGKQEIENSIKEKLNIKINASAVTKPDWLNN